MTENVIVVVGKSTFNSTTSILHLFWSASMFLKHTVGSVLKKRNKMDTEWKTASH